MSTGQGLTYTVSGDGWPTTSSGGAQADRTRARMSFEFLAPMPQYGGEIGFSESSASFAVDPRTYYTSRSDALGSVYANATDMAATHYEGSQDSTLDEEDGVHDQSTARSGGKQRSKGSHSSKRKREEDRHEYDDEELYTILYLRIERGEKWAQVLQYFNVLFPPGQPRRLREKNLTTKYHQRAKGGLECRYYRLRQDLKFPAVRSSVHNNAEDKVALERVQGSFRLSSEFLQFLNILCKPSETS